MTEYLVAEEVIMGYLKKWPYLLRTLQNAINNNTDLTLGIREVEEKLKAMEAKGLVEFDGMRWKVKSNAET